MRLTYLTPLTLRQVFTEVLFLKCLRPKRQNTLQQENQTTRVYFWFRTIVLSHFHAQLT